MQELHDLVDKGVLYEDDFIAQYLEVLRDEGFMNVFGANKEEARGILTTLIDESKGHREGLVKLKESLH